VVVVRPRDHPEVIREEVIVIILGVVSVEVIVTVDMSSSHLEVSSNQ